MPPGNRARAGAMRCYRLLLLIYPRAFRQAYGMEMLRLFRDCCPKTDDTRDWIVFWSQMLADTATAAAVEHITAGRAQMARHRGTITLLGAALAAVTAVGYVNTHTDETGIIAGSLLLIAVALSAIRPRWVVGWLVLAMASLPVSQLVMHLLALRVPYPNSYADILNAAVPAAIIATIGSAIGWALGQIVRRQWAAVSQS